MHARHEPPPPPPPPEQVVQPTSNSPSAHTSNSPSLIPQNHNDQDKVIWPSKKKNHHYLFIGYRSGYLNRNPLCHQKKKKNKENPPQLGQANLEKAKAETSFSGIVGIKVMSATQRSARLALPAARKYANRREVGRELTMMMGKMKAAAEIAHASKACEMAGPASRARLGSRF